MKKIFIIIGFCTLSFCLSQTLTNSENYIFTRKYLEPVSTAQSNAQQVQTVQYFDGLGRATQSIAVKATPSGQDMAVPFYYENGRMVKNYLPVPVPTQNGAYHGGLSGGIVNDYYGVPNAYTEIEYEDSPSPKITQKASPGSEWQINGPNTYRWEYLSNSDSEVKRLKAVTSWDGVAKISNVSIDFAPNDDYTQGGYYKPNTLYKVISKDEDKIETHTFTNSAGQQILIRKINQKEDGSVEDLDTYYVHDDNGNLAFVIPPKAAVFSSIAQLSSMLNSLCYQYKYDKYNRLVEKRLPGRTHWESIVYDQQGRPLLSQDANQYNSKWAFVKYDKFGRLLYNGIYSSTLSRKDLQSAADNASFALVNETRTASSFTANGQNIYYSKTAHPFSNVTVLAAHYYDTYPEDSPPVPADILGEGTLSPTPVSVTVNGYPSTRSARDLPTASFVKNVENDEWTKSFVWFDKRSRVIGTHSINHLGGSTAVEHQLNFTGALLASHTVHKRLNISPEVSVLEDFEYDDHMRLLNHYHQVNSEPAVLLAQYNYNELGQLTEKSVGDGLQEIDYSYNIRGWLTGLNDPQDLNGRLFGYKLNYNNLAVPNYSEPRYNGTVAQVEWAKSTDAAGYVRRRYDYTYDHASHLTAAVFSEPDAAVPLSNSYNENISYDLNGNITQLLRKAPSYYGPFPEQIDELEYQYNGNMLTGVTDNSNNSTGFSGGGYDVHYDGNGNMITMPDRDAAISYNHLNLPHTVNTHNNSQNTFYLYRSDGKKLRKNFSYINTNNMVYSTTTEYLDGFHYFSSVGNFDLAFMEESGVAYEQEGFTAFVHELNPNFELKFFPTAEGFYDFENNQYIYQYKDHLGNVRLSYRDSGGGPEVVDSNDYYPFGMSFVRNEEEEAQYGSGSFFNYKYNGKELQDTGLYDYGWRQYMPELGRWNGMDQLSEMYLSTSPYGYVSNNPITYRDPDGRCNSNAAGEFSGDCAFGIEEVVIVKAKGKTPKITEVGATPFSSGNIMPGSFGGLSGASGEGSGGGSSGGLGMGLDDILNGGGYKTPEINVVPQPQVTPTMSDFDWDRVVELLTNPATDGIINGSSALVARGLKNWDTASTIVKTKVIAETISTKTPFSAQTLKNASPYLKWGGRVVGALGIFNTGLDWRNGEISASRAGLDTAMGIIGFMGPGGAVISLTYFGSVALYEHFYGNQFFSKDEFY
ncbi:RHS repeat-associated core domain-containing protein [Chryseobacterium sp. cx-311]|uniref:DUF6443 domain-containing protein n=1 Tax=Marnyiella aurantia TaxID=2758037 RepID=UPI001AE5E539|nr:DUF6443 domain-containing protein [Marnyiella aurantia]MBP0612928.1 RHS repeat-associated core domain-containing protein [Marnyiella aurantia]